MITYSYKIKQLNTVSTEFLNDVVSHIHFDYIGTDENGISAFCQGVVPFQVTDYTYTDTVTNKPVTIPSVVDKDNFTSYDKLTQEQVISWIEMHLPVETINTYKMIIAEQLKNKQENKNYLPWNL